MEQCYLMPGQERCEKIKDANGVPKVSYSYRSLQGQNPYRISDGTVEIVPIRPGRGERLRIEQADAGSVAFELHQPVLMPIPEAGCAFRVRGKGAM